MIGNKIAKKITPVGKTKGKEKKTKDKKSTYHQKKDNKLLMTWDLRPYKNEIPKKYKLDTTSDNLPRFITIKWLEVHDQSGGAEDRYKPSKQIRFKTSILRSDLFDFTDAYIVVKGDITLTKNDCRGLVT